MFFVQTIRSRCRRRGFIRLLRDEREKRDRLNKKALKSIVYSNRCFALTKIHQWYYVIDTSRKWVEFIDQFASFSAGVKRVYQLASEWEKEKPQ